MSDRELRRRSRTRLSERGEVQGDLPAPETRRWVARRKAQSGGRRARRNAQP